MKEIKISPPAPHSSERERAVVDWCINENPGVIRLANCILALTKTQKKILAALNDHTAQIDRINNMLGVKSHCEYQDNAPCAFEANNEKKNEICSTCWNKYRMSEADSADCAEPIRYAGISPNITGALSPCSKCHGTEYLAHTMATCECAEQSKPSKSCSFCGTPDKDCDTCTSSTKGDQRVDRHTNPPEKKS